MALLLPLELIPTHTFEAAGNYPVELTVEDGGGLTDTATITIIVSSPGNEAPVAVLSATPLNGEAPSGGKLYGQQLHG